MFLPEGMVVHINEKYVIALVELCRLDKLKEKAISEHLDLLKEDKSLLVQ